MKLLIIFSSILFFVACTKLGKNVTIKGHVLNPVTGVGIEGAEVKVLKTAGGFNGGFKAIKTVKSNSDGSFEISKLSLEHCYVVCRTPLDVDYYQIGWEKKASVPLYDAFTISVKKGKTMHADYYAVPQGKYKVIFNNINCQGLSDSIIIKQSNVVNSFLDNEWIIKGCDGYETAFSNVPVGTITTSYVVKRNGVVNSFTTYFDVIPNQENIQAIDY